MRTKIANELSSVTSPGQMEHRLVHQGKVRAASILHRHRVDCLENISLGGLRERGKRTRSLGIEGI